MKMGLPRRPSSGQIAAFNSLRPKRAALAHSAADEKMIDDSGI